MLERWQIVTTFRDWMQCNRMGLGYLHLVTGSNNTFVGVLYCACVYDTWGSFIFSLCIWWFWGSFNMSTYPSFNAYSYCPPPWFGHWDHDTWPVTRLVSPVRRLWVHTKKPKRSYILSGWLREPTVPCHQQQFHNSKWPASMWYSGRLTVWCVVVNGIRFRETRRNYSSILSFYVFFSHSYKLHFLILLVHYPSLNFTSSWVGGDYFNVLELGTDEPSMQHD